MKKLLLLAVLLAMSSTAAELRGAGDGAGIAKLTQAQIAASLPCITGTAVVFLEDSALGACDELGGGTENSDCYCDDAGTAYGPGSSVAGASHPVADSIAIVEDNVDPTKEVKLELGGLTTLTTRVLTVPDEDIDLHGSKQDHEGRYGIANVLDYGAACDFTSGVSSPTNDAVAIQDAINAAWAASPQLTVLFPAMCYTESKIDWKNGADLLGVDKRSSGIVCAASLTDHCVEASASGIYFFSTMSQMRVSRQGICNPESSKVCVGSGSGCTACDTVAGGNEDGINLNGLITQEKKLLYDIWVSAFPRFGVHLERGTTPFWGDYLHLWGNGHDPATTGTAECGTPDCSTSLIDDEASWSTTGGDAVWCGSCTGTGEHIGRKVYITGGTGQGQVRVVKTSNATTLTVTAWDVEPDDTSTYSIDAGGGIVIRGGGTGSMTGCGINNISGDANEGGLVVIAGGSQHSNADSCSIRNAKIELGPTLCGITIEDGAPFVTLDQVSVTGAASTPAGSSAICIEGSGSNISSMEWFGVSIEEADVDYTLNTEWEDDAANRVQIQRLDSAYLPTMMFLNRTTAPPFTCVGGIEGVKYYDTDLGSGEWCYCNGTDWIETMPEVAGAAEVCT